MAHLPYDTYPGVNVHGLNWRMRVAEQVAVAAWDQIVGGRFTMSSAADRSHGEWSFHYKGLAFDITLRGVDRLTAQRFVDKLLRKLGPPFQIIHHDGSHVHVECDLYAHPEWVGRDIRKAVLP